MENVHRFGCFMWGLCGFFSWGLLWIFHAEFNVTFYVGFIVISCVA